MNTSITRWLGEPALRGLSLDDSTSAQVHREILSSKPLLRSLFLDFYRQCRDLDEQHFGDGPGRRLELGAGSSFMNQIYPDVVSSDIKCLPFLNMATSGLALPFRDDSLRAIYAINVFHHLPDVNIFFREALRALRPGGGVVLIEPFHGPVASWLFKRLHATETFDASMEDWAYDTTGPMSDANQAMAYIVFHRDRQLFEERFPGLEILVSKPHTHARYVLSGGVNFRALVPTPLSWVAHGLEKILAPANRLIALQQTIVLRKRP